MKYLVIIDARSNIGAIYLNGNNDGTTSGSEINHPIIDCTEVRTSDPYYLFAKRQFKQEGKSHQSLYIPHQCVVAIYQYEEKEGRPIGF